MTIRIRQNGITSICDNHTLMTSRTDFSDTTGDNDRHFSSRTGDNWSKNTNRDTRRCRFYETSPLYPFHLRVGNYTMKTPS